MDTSRLKKVMISVGLLMALPVVANADPIGDVSSNWQAMTTIKQQYETLFVHTQDSLIALIAENRKLGEKLAQTIADGEAREATLIEWLKLAQAKECK